MMMRKGEEEKEEEDDFVVKVDLSDEDVRSGGEGGREGEMEGVGDQRSEGDTATRSHEPPYDQPSTSTLPSMESEHSLGLPDDKRYIYEIENLVQVPIQFNARNSNLRI